MRRWGQDSLWLHVDKSNEAAMQLYKSCGYNFVRKELFSWPEERLLLKKEIEPWHAPAAAAALQFGPSPGPQVTGGSTRTLDGVFVWDTAPE